MDKQVMELLHQIQGDMNKRFDSFEAKIDGIDNKVDTIND